MGVLALSKRSRARRCASRSGPRWPLRRLRIPARSGVVFAEDALGALADSCGARHDAAFVVPDRDLIAAGRGAARCCAPATRGVRTELFDGIGPQPHRRCRRSRAPLALRAFGTAIVVAIGGGSPIDAAKAIALDAGEGRPAPIVAIPTTAGTGAETNGFGVIEDVAARRKRYIGRRDDDARATPSSTPRSPSPPRHT